jgi:hypothetical protein
MKIADANQSVIGFGTEPYLLYCSVEDKHMRYLSALIVFVALVPGEIRGLASQNAEPGHEKKSQSKSKMLAAHPL